MGPLIAAAILAAGAALPAAADTRSQDAACLAEAIYYEARGTGPEGRAAVAHVVLNRAEHDDFPDTPCAVVADGCQFSYRCDGRPIRLADAAERARAWETATRVLDGVTPDPTAGALFFHAAGISSRFHQSRPRIGQIGGNVFYR
jgi:N-acetylmuramoyl-L-alanine amidase